MNAKRFIGNIISIIFWILVWQIASMAAGLEILLPSPLTTLKTLISLVSTSNFWLICLVSMARILAGLFTGAVVAVLLAGITYVSKTAYIIFSPVLTVIKATPVASFIILALIWIGRDTVPSFITFLIVMPIVWSAVYHAMTNVDVKLLEVAKVFSFNSFQKLKHIYFPSVFPSFMSAFMTSIGIGWKAGVAAEVLCTPRYSIGTSIFESKKYFETPDLFAWTITVIVLSLVIEKLLYNVCSFIAERSKNDKN